jgi:hypothetical protein
MTPIAGQFWWGAKPLKGYQRRPMFSLNGSETRLKVQKQMLD